MWRPPSNPTSSGQPPFWPPRASKLWAFALEPLRQFYLHRHFGIKKVELEGHVNVIAPIAQTDGILLAPNHSHDSDPHVMIQVVRWLGRRPHFMAAWQIFQGRKGLDGFVLQRMGAFSVDREGCDRRAIRQAVEILSTGKALVIFPEGEIYHLNDRLTPLRDGVAFIAQSAQREIDKRDSHRRVWVVPTAIRYRYADDIEPKLSAAMAALEERMLLAAPPGMPLAQRIIRFGDMMLTLKEKDLLGRSTDAAGADLPARIASFTSTLLEQLEIEHLGGTSPDVATPLRVKNLRRHLVEGALSANGEFAEASSAFDPRISAALERLHVVLQLYSYPGDYLSGKPCPERMAETIEKFEEDIHGFSRVKGQRIARVILGKPIDVREHLKTPARPRVAAMELTSRLEKEIQSLMNSR